GGRREVRRRLRRRHDDFATGKGGVLRGRSRRAPAKPALAANAASLIFVIELIGDSSRGADFALVRLRLEDERIVDAEAAGLEESLIGLTLLEAAAVGGETLAADALANAIGPVFRAPRSPGRTAVAMRGGVDGAAALLRSLANASGVTLRRSHAPNG